MNPVETVKQFENEMRPWVYRLVLSQIIKAVSYGDKVGINAFLQLCDHNILLTKTDIEQFDLVMTSLLRSPYCDSYQTAIRINFRLVYGDNVEGM